MSILEKLTQLHELNTIISKKSKDFSYLIKINIYKSLIDFIDINSENEFIKYFNKIIIGFKSSKYYTIGNELQNSINTFQDINDFMLKIDNIKGGLINNNIIDFYNELYSFIIKQLAIYVPSKKSLKKIIEPKKEEEVVVKKTLKKTIELKKIIIEEPKKKELTPYNAFFKEQSLLIKDNSEIKNKMEYIAKLWKEQKEIKEDKKEDKKETTYNKSGLKHPEKADLDKNKKISGYEKVRGKAIQNAVQDEKEEKGSKDKKDDKGLSKAQMNLPEGLRKAIAAKKK